MVNSFRVGDPAQGSVQLHYIIKVYSINAFREIRFKYVHLTVIKFDIEFEAHDGTTFLTNELRFYNSEAPRAVESFFTSVSNGFLGRDFSVITYICSTYAFIILGKHGYILYRRFARSESNCLNLKLKTFIFEKCKTIRSPTDCRHATLAYYILDVV